MAEDHLTPAERAERGSYVSCIAGALTFTEYRNGLAAAGFTDIEVTPTHEVGDGMHSAIVRATKPADAAAPQNLPIADQNDGACCGVNACCTADENSADPTTTVTDAKVTAGCGCQN
ncbi:hypothetical protein C8D88_102775 [Lentzea atacamensis]|uniref:Uncharacterized protein n=1 Tax=Lentzea atacamensis TaxID=531938 RepID=A0A316I8E5_9PSEU|nr:hypothetical protein C8D88_102775 [Lentzea atacamensis]